MTGEASSNADPTQAGRKVKFIVKNENILKGKFKKIAQTADAYSTSVHIRIGFEQEYFLRPPLKAGKLSVIFDVESGSLPFTGNVINGHKPDIVSLAGMLGPGVSEADQSNWQ